jgi:hypothetical protein
MIKKDQVLDKLIEMFCLTPSITDKMLSVVPYIGMDLVSSRKKILSKKMLEVADNTITEQLEANQQTLQLKNDDFIELATAKYTTHKHLVKHLLKQELEYLAREEPRGEDWATIQELLLKVCVVVADEIVSLDSLVSIQPMPGPTSLIYQMVYEQVDPYQPLLSDWRAPQLNFVTIPITAKSRTFQTKFRTDILENDKIYEKLFGLELMKALVNVLAREVGYEICSEVVHDILEITTPNISIISQPEGEPAIPYPTKVGLAIAAASNAIARSTRRGQANVLLTSTVGLSNLKSYIIMSEQQLGWKYEPATNNNNDSNMYHAGDIICATSKKIIHRVLVTTCLRDDDNYDTFILGYKSPVSGADAGYVYSPCVMIGTAGTTIGDFDFVPSVQLKTRYGKHIVDSNSKNTYGKTENYYRTIRVQQMTDFWPDC